MIQRRSVLPVLLAAFSAAVFAQTTFTGPVTGQAVPALAGLDQAMENILTKYQVPGGELAVSYKGRLVYARGFGYADSTSGTSVQPDSLLRTASVSKVFTSAAILKLIEQGKLQIDQAAFALLPDLQPAPGKTLNPQLALITIGQLLNHTSGLKDNSSNDPMQGLSVNIANAMNAPSPANCNTIIRYELSQPLQSTPGSTYAYSNLGYCVLSSIIEHVSGMNYEQFVRQSVLIPLGIGRAKMADPLISDVVNQEVTYYDYPGAPLAEDIYNPTGPEVPSPYGGPGTNFLAKEGTGGWATTTVDLLRFLNGLDGLRPPALFQASTIQLLETETPNFAGAASYYGYGMNMIKVSGGFDWWKGGDYPGTNSQIERFASGVAYAVIFNSDPNNADFVSDYETQIVSVLNGVASYPTGDLFPNFQSTLVAPSLFTSANPVISAATFLPGIVSGSWVAVKGSNLATTTRVWRGDEFGGSDFSVLPDSVASVSVTIDGKPAAVYYVSPTQINVQAPADTNTGMVPVVVTHDGQSSPPVQAQLVSAAPGWLTYPSGNNVFAVGIHLDGSTIGDPSVNPGLRPAKPNEAIAFYGTGFTASPAGTANITVTPLAPFPSVTIGNMSANVTFGGLTGVGLFQVNVVVPALPPGVYPVVVSWGGVTSPASAEILISN